MEKKIKIQIIFGIIALFMFGIFQNFTHLNFAENSISKMRRLGLFIGKKTF